MIVYTLLAAAVFGTGIWIGVGAPGWPVKTERRRSRLERRSINPIAWGRTPGRERQRPRSASERKIKLR
jgi:hypothetical protein